MYINDFYFAQLNIAVKKYYIMVRKVRLGLNEKSSYININNRNDIIYNYCLC